MADSEQGRVRIEQIQGFQQFTNGLATVRGSLGAVGAHEHVVPQPPGILPLAELTAQFGGLRAANEAAITRLADFTTRADRGMAGLAFVSTYIATNFPQTDMANEQEMLTLMFDGQQAAPPVPDNQPAIDPTFQSKPDTE